MASAAAATLLALPVLGAAEQVAIVGAGIAGSSAAWFLRHEGLDVTVFERERVGGRVREAQFPEADPIMVEAGGAAIHSLNKYMAEFIDALGLHRDTELLKNTALGADGASSWDGEKLTPVNPLAYPLSFLRARHMVSNVTTLWEQIYGMQAKNRSFSHPREMLEALGVAQLANTSARDWMRGKLDDGFVRQFVDGVSRINYGQDSSINAFADAVSLAGAGLVGTLFSVKEGNAKVMEGLIRDSGATLRHETVVAVRRGADGYTVCTRGGSCSPFGSVIIAAPLESAGLELETSLRPPTPARPFQVTVATFVAALSLNPEYFRSSHAVDETTIMTVANASIPFNSVAVHGVAGARKVYKLFSPAVPSEELIREMFLNASAERRQFVWNAYPVLRPFEEWPAFRLHSGARGGVYYANAMESPVSCMETEAVAGKNVALLLAEDMRAARPRSGTKQNNLGYRADTYRSQESVVI